MKRILFLFLVIISFTSCAGQTNTNFTGVWYREKNPEKTIIEDFSWGEGKIIPNFSIVIDLAPDDSFIRLPMIGGPFTITGLEKIKPDQYILTFFFQRGGFNVSYIIHVVGKDTIWFELQSNQDLTFIPTGANYLWYKLSGPKQGSE